MNFDWKILENIQNIFKCKFFDWLMPKITVLGDGGIIWIIIGLCMIISKKYRKNGVLVLAGLVLGLIIGNGFVKNIVQRPRPCWIDTDFQMLIGVPKDYSFPSGHTQASCIAATIVTLTNKKIGFVVIPMALLIGFSRMYLYVHFPTDILGGMVIGITIGAFTYILGRKLLKIDKI